jgi:hypothetical protein
VSGRTSRTLPGDRIETHGTHREAANILFVHRPEDPIVTFIIKATALKGALAGSDATNGARFLLPFFVFDYGFVAFWRDGIRLRIERNIYGSTILILI